MKAQRGSGESFGQQRLRLQSFDSYRKTAPGATNQATEGQVLSHPAAQPVGRTLSSHDSAAEPQGSVKFYVHSDLLHKVRLDKFKTF